MFLTKILINSTDICLRFRVFSRADCSVDKVKFLLKKISYTCLKKTVISSEKLVHKTLEIIPSVFYNLGDYLKIYSQSTNAPFKICFVI